MKQTTKTIWDEAIEDYEDYGFRIECPEDFLLILYFKDKLIATFYQDKITPDILREGCKTYFNNINRGFEV